MNETKKNVFIVIMTIFYIIYSFNTRHSLFENTFFQIFIACSFMFGKHMGYKYSDIIQFIALPITISVFFYVLDDYGSFWRHGFFYLRHLTPSQASLVLLFNCFSIATVFSPEPLKWLRRIKVESKNI
jgi:hypothetical protein